MADYSDLSDPDLIARCLEQDAGAWEALVWRYERLIAATTYRCGLTAADAADVFQTVCLILLRHLAAVRKQETLSNWLITVTMRECWRFRRQGGPTASLDDPESGEVVGNLSAVPPLAESQILALERQHLIRHEVELLPEPCRTLLERLFYTDDPPAYAELSQELGMPVASIGPTRARCLTKLKAALRKAGFS